MEKSEVLQKVVTIISSQLNTDVNKLDENSKLGDGDIQVDSLDVVEIVMALEDEFGIEIPENAASGFKTIGDIVDFVHGLLNK